jgi:hypothetical protein
MKSKSTSKKGEIQGLIKSSTDNKIKLLGKRTLSVSPDLKKEGREKLEEVRTDLLKSKFLKDLRKPVLKMEDDEPVSDEEYDESTVHEDILDNLPLVESEVFQSANFGKLTPQSEKQYKKEIIPSQ